MSSNVCASCLRTASRQRTSAPRTLRASIGLTARSFSATSRGLAEGTATYTPLSGSKDPQPRKNAPPASKDIRPRTSETSAYSPSIKSRDNQHAPSKTSAAVAELNKIHGGTVDAYASYGATELLYKECAGQAPYTIPAAKEGEEIEALEDGTQVGIGEGWWYAELGLKPTFTSWTQVTMLHMYLISARFRCFSPDVCKTWQQHFIDHFFTDAENRMIVNHDLQARGARNGYLKDLFLQWRGILLAYDEGLMKGDAVLASAVWRNLCNADPEVDVRKLAMIVSFMRKTMKELEGTTDLVLVDGSLKFGGPLGEKSLVGLPSGMIKLPLEQAPVQATQTEQKA